MILKEAFRLQNFLTVKIQECNRFLIKNGNIMSVTEKHLKSKGNPNAVDEEIKVSKDTEYQANDVIDLAMDLMTEKEKLSRAISQAKRTGRDVDMELSINKTKQQFIQMLTIMNGYKSSEEKTTGRDYMINQNGDQTTYVYPVETVTTIDFDRNKVKGILSRLRKEVDETSNAVDQINVSLQVDYEPKYEVGDSFEDVMEAFLASRA